MSQVRKQGAITFLALKMVKIVIKISLHDNNSNTNNFES